MKRQRIFIRTGLAVIAPLLLATHWLLVADAVRDGRLFAYITYWNQPVWTVLLAITLGALTALWIWAILRFWNYSGDVPTEG